jgi:hypothetical protein
LSFYTLSAISKQEKGVLTMRKPKRGDIVAIDHKDTVGEIVMFDATTKCLRLKIPEGLPNGPIREFYPVEQKDITFLRVKDLLARIPHLIEINRYVAQNKLEEAVSKVFNRLL